MTDVTGVVTESVLPSGGTIPGAGSLASVVASGLAAGTWFRCPGVAGPACSAVTRARVVSTMPRSAGGDGDAVSSGRPRIRSARWRR